MKKNIDIFKKERNYKKPIIIFIVIVLIFAGSYSFEKFKEKYREEGFNTAINSVVYNILNDLKNQGYTTLRVGNETLKLGVVQ